MFVVVGYDIPDDERRARVAVLLEEFGQRVQRSVFECHLDARSCRQMQRELNELLDPQDDDVRLYFLCERCFDRAAPMGKAKLSVDPDYLLV